MKVYHARTNLLYKFQGEAIHKLLELMKDTAYVKLSETGDLIYPGGEKYLSHGGVVDYDIDWLSVRAAWILEDITFQDFGFVSSYDFEQKTLTQVREEDCQKYLKRGYIDGDEKDTSLNARLIRGRLFLATEAGKWWDKNGKSWNKLDAIKDALSSKNEHRIDMAVNYLRSSGTTLEQEKVVRAYYPYVKSLVRKVKRSRSVHRKQAKYLLEKIIETEGS